MADEDGLQMRYFVLRPKGDDAHARASRTAMRAYAYAMRDHKPKLAQEVSDWVDEEMRATEKKDA